MKRKDKQPALNKKKSSSKRDQKREESADMLTHEEIRIMSYNHRKGPTLMEIEEDGRKEEEDSDREYDVGDLRKNDSNLDVVADVVVG